jgi:HPr kinase/phosphorylase
VSEAVTLGRLVELHGERLGMRGGDPSTLGQDLGVSEAPVTSLVGHMNLIRPNRIQVLGAAELAYINDLDNATAGTILGLLIDTRPACLIVADGLAAPERLSAACSRAGTVVLKARASSHQVVQELGHFLARTAARRASMHGVFIEVMGVGVLLTGMAGVGKSELALELVSRGHRLIADDAPDFARVAPDTVEGSCPPALLDFMEVRGLGIVNVRALFGDSAVKPRRTLRLVVNLAVIDHEDYSPEQRLEGIRGTRDILGVAIPQVSLPVAPGRNMAVLVECTVRNFILGMKGYRAADDFANRHVAIMRGDDIAER